MRFPGATFVCSFVLLALAGCSSGSSSAGGGGSGTGSGVLTSSAATTSTAASTSSVTTSTASSTSASASSSTGMGGAGGVGGAGGAGGVPPTMLDLTQVKLFDNPPNLANWPITTKITSVEFQYNGMDGVRVEFDKRDGPNAWPPVTPPGWMGPLEYTLGLAEYINGEWVASAAIQFWPGLDASGGNVALNNQIAVNWYYDGRWGPLAGYQPKTGELIGVFVVAGNARGVMSDDPLESPVMERSNVVVVPMPDVNGAKYTF